MSEARRKLEEGSSVPGGATPTSPTPTTPWRDMEGAVRRGLTSRPRTLPSKFFYDRRGSELFERITRLPEYYLTDAEIEILRGEVRRWIEEEAPRSVVELGAGSARKTRILLEAMTEERRKCVYVPVDVSAEFLETTARRLRREHRSLDVCPVVADLTQEIVIEEPLPSPTSFALLGSTIGNFKPPQDRVLLRQVAGIAAPGDTFLLGADLRPGPRKPLKRLLRAYDDGEGVTAAFNRNILRVVNRGLGTTFAPEEFRHRIVYDDERHWIEMHLVTERDQETLLPDGTEVRIEAGESIRTEVSCKYDRDAVQELFAETGFALEAWWTDPEEIYAVALGRREEGG